MRNSNDAVLVRPLLELGRGDIAVVGGKNASLGEMIGRLQGAGIKLPGGFATTAAAYRQFLAAQFPAELSAAISRGYRDLGRPAVAVRSSATAEDLPEASFAGQLESFLNVRGEQALLRC